MSEWREYELEKLVSIGSSKRIFYKEYVDEGIPFYRSKEVIEKNKKDTVSTELFISQDRYNEIKTKFGVPRKGDILLTSVGTLGVPWLIDDSSPFYFKDGNLTWISKFSKDLLNIYFYYWIISPLGKESLDMISIGSTQPAITIRGLRSIDISLPPLPEQIAIAEVLSSLDDKIDLLHRQNKTLEQMAETLFRQWFVEEAGEDWEEKPLNYFGDVICGKTPSKKKPEYHDGEIPFIKIPDMHGNTFIFNTADTLTDEGSNSQKNKLLPPKSICVSCIATVGLVSMNIVESQTNQQINSIIPKEDKYRYFLYLYMKSSYNLLHAMAGGGTATLNLNTGNFQKINILKPDDNTLNEFNLFVEPQFNKIFANQQQINTLESLRDTLLPKLMSGEVRVN